MEISKEEYEAIVVPKIKLEFDKDLSYSERYQSARKNAWSKLSNKEKQAFLDLPHFNAEIFLDITGVDVTEDSITEVTMKEVCEKFWKNVKIIK